MMSNWFELSRFLMMIQSLTMIIAFVGTIIWSRHVSLYHSFASCPLNWAALVIQPKTLKSFAITREIRPYTDKHGELPSAILSWRNRTLLVRWTSFNFDEVSLFYFHFCAWEPRKLARGVLLAREFLSICWRWAREDASTWTAGCTAILVHGWEIGLARRSDGTLSAPHCFSGSILYSLLNFVLAVLSRYRTAFPAVSCTHSELRSSGPHEALVRARSRAAIPRAGYRKVK